MAALHITIVETMPSSESGMNPVAITIINPQIEYWPSRRSNQRPPVLKSTTLPTELWGLAALNLDKLKIFLCGKILKHLLQGH